LAHVLFTSGARGKERRVAALHPPDEAEYYVDNQQAILVPEFQVLFYL
jgi:hypothetical protein